MNTLLYSFDDHYFEGGQCPYVIADDRQTNVKANKVAMLTQHLSYTLEKLKIDPPKMELYCDSIYMDEDDPCEFTGDVEGSYESVLQFMMLLTPKSNVYAMFFEGVEQHDLPVGLDYRKIRRVLRKLPDHGVRFDSQIWDWSKLEIPAYLKPERRVHYVYAYREMQSQRLVYVGIGSTQNGYSRAEDIKSHITVARKYESEDLEIDILDRGLSRREAAAVERNLIKNIPGLLNIQHSKENRALRFLV